MKRTVFSLIFFLLYCLSFAQGKLKPEFDAYEYAEMLKVTAWQVDTNVNKPSLPHPEKYNMVYRSDSVGLDNRWELWLSGDSIGVISIRGTVLSSAS